MILDLSATYSGIGIAKADSVIATIPGLRGPVGVAFDSANGNLYVANSIDNTVSVMSGQTNTIIGSPIPVGSGPLGIAFDSANGNLYVANFNGNTVSIISGQTNTVIGSPIPEAGGAPESIAFDSANGNLYVANRGDNTVSVISGQTNTVIDSIGNIGINPDAIAFDSTNGNLYVDSFYDNTVSVISGQTNTIIGSPIPVGAAPLGIAFDSANGNLYVTNGRDNTVSVMSGQTNTIIGSPIPAGPTPVAIAFNSANGNLYVTNVPNSNGNTVSVISGQTNTVIGSPIRVGVLPEGIAFDSVNHNLYVANAGDDTVSVISTSSLLPHATITSAVDGNGAIIQSGGTTFSTAIKFTFTGSAGTNPVAGFECSLDNGGFSSCSSPTTLTNLAVGPHTFQVRALDSSGNRDPTTASFSWKIAALYPPSHTTITSAIDGNGAEIPDGGTTISSSITLTLSAVAGTYPIAGFQCSIDNSQFSSCTSPVALHNLAAGSHRFTAVAVDTAGNRDPTPASFSWTILTPAQGIEQLIQTINSMHLNPGTQANLDAQLNGILTTLSLPIKNNLSVLLSTCPHLDAFVNTVIPDYLHAGQLNPNQAAQIIQSAQNIQKALGCTGNGH